ncbi:MAG: hypothetical protein DWI57_08725 [Chloroflexi bacterium]|nr:MAG: hypothetical protein DWI57_08725 [Chloroflexota bacterium]
MAALLAALRRPSITNQPPSPSEQRRNDLLVIVVILFAIFLGWGIRYNSGNAVRQFALGDQLPTLAYPAAWLEAQSDGVLFRAIDPASPSAFDARVELFVRDLKEGETLDTLSASWPLRRTQELERFRNLAVEVAQRTGDQPALVFTYAYIADPTRESGSLGLPVVVKGQDLLFIANDGIGERLVVTTVTADATEWESHTDAFTKIFASLGVQEGE